MRGAKGSKNSDTQRNREKGRSSRRVYNYGTLGVGGTVTRKGAQSKGEKSKGRKKRKNK